MSERCAIVPEYESSAPGVDTDGGFPFRLQESLGCVTFPLFTGGLRGSFRFSTHRASQAQRLSPTAVYPPCPRATRVNLDACEHGHGGYTATG